MSLKPQIEALRAQGLSYNDIQKELKCSKGTIAYYLGEGQKQKTRQRQKDARARIGNYIIGVKDNQHCVDCGVSYRYWVMDFDHLVDKSFNIGHYRSHTNDIQRIREEMEKCEIICSNCHRDRTYRRRVEQDDLNAGLDT